MGITNEEFAAIAADLIKALESNGAKPDDIDLVVIREGKNVKGRLLGLVLRTIGKSVLEKAFRNSVKAIEARNGGTSEKHEIEAVVASNAVRIS